MTMEGNNIEMPPLQESGINTDSSVSVIGSAAGDDGNNSGLSQLALSSASTAPVPDVLLSIAKDNRYISDVVSLLSQVMVPYASIVLVSTSSSGRDRNNNLSSGNGSGGAPNNNFTNDEILEDDGQRFIDRIRPELNLLASLIVHSATFIYYTRNFGGGDTSATTTAANGNRRSESIQRSLGMESLNLAYQYPANNSSRDTTPLSSSSSSTAKGINQSNRSNKVMTYIKNHPRIQVNQWHRLLLLQTIVPYIIQRVGRGGWVKDFNGILEPLFHRIGLQRISGIGRRSQRTIINRSENESREEESAVLLNNDRLRGSARRRLFMEQRQRMLSASSSGLNDGNNTELGESSENITADDTQQTSLSLQQPSVIDRRMKRIATFSWNTIRRISLAISSLSHGAHSLPRHSDGSHTANDNIDRYTKMIKWFLRLHLALFYWNGMYPTVAHRLAGTKFRDDIAPYSHPGSTFHSPMSGAIVANRPTYKPIAVMILLQAAAALAQTSAEISVDVAHYIQVAFFRWRRRRRGRLQNQQHQQQHRNGRFIANNHDATNSERAEYMDMIEERVPGIASAKKDYITKKKNQTGSGKKDGSDIHPCGICLNERVHPAAPSGCGHVFCWNCILHWVSNVRHECPLCRAQTRPQDIIPLYNYP